MTVLSRTHTSFRAFVCVRKEEKLCNLQLFTALSAGVRCRLDGAGQTLSLMIVPRVHSWTL